MFLLSFLDFKARFTPGILFLVLFSATHACETLFPLFPFTSNFFAAYTEILSDLMGEIFGKTNCHPGRRREKKLLPSSSRRGRKRNTGWGKEKEQEEADNLWRGERTKSGVCAWRRFPRDLSWEILFGRVFPVGGSISHAVGFFAFFWVFWVFSLSGRGFRFSLSSLRA